MKTIFKHELNYKDSYERITKLTNPLQSSKNFIKILIKRGCYYKWKKHKVPHCVIDKLGVGMFIELFKLPPASVISFATTTLSCQSKRNVKAACYYDNDKLDEWPGDFGCSSHILPVRPLEINYLIKNILAFGTHHKLQIGRRQNERNDFSGYFYLKSIILQMYRSLG